MGVVDVRAVPVVDALRRPRGVRRVTQVRRVQAVRAVLPLRLQLVESGRGPIPDASHIVTASERRDLHTKPNRFTRSPMVPVSAAAMYSPTSAALRLKFS